MKNFLLTFSMLLLAFVGLKAQIISEIDADQTGTDSQEFVELSGTANASLNGYVLILINGSNDQTYECYDLDGQSFDANGYFTIGNATGVNLTVSPSTNWLQNGADAVALVQTASCPTDNSACSSIPGTIVSAIVYDTNDADDSGLLTCLGETTQYNEDGENDSEGQSLQWNGVTWILGGPTLGSPPPGGLPITLTSFEAKTTDNKSVALTWQTASEENNDYFSIEHSLDGTSFREIGTKVGNGTTELVQNYSFLHEEVENGLHYYRLKQVDFDGKFEYSNIVTAKISRSNDDIFLTPNPSSNVIFVQTKTPYQRDADFQILNMQGQVVLSSVLQEGNTEMELNISDFPVGIYYLQLFVDNDVMMKKIIKQ